MDLFEKLQQQLTYLPPNQITKVREAYSFAAKAHGPQERASGELYIVHPLSTAVIVANMRMDHESIIAALLHDVVEDTDISLTEITNTFGPNVGNIVDGLTKLKRTRFSNRAEMQAESFRKTILSMSNDIRVILVKLADRFHNAKTLHELPPEKINRIANETLEIYAPIARRLGMHTMAIDIENYCFKALYPWRYKILEKTLNKIHDQRKPLLDSIEQNIQEKLTENGIGNASVFSYEKHIYSLYKHMSIHKIAVEIFLRNHMFRIIVDTNDNCYRALGVLHSAYKPIPGKFRDYVAMPKVNGYQSLHTTLFGPQSTPIKVQIRTQVMEHRANYGIAANWLYASDNQPHKSTSFGEQRWINNLLEIQQNTASSLEFIEHVKNDLFPNDIYLFTPKGRIVELPRGSTVIDFAYSIHTEIGNHCTSAKINQRFVPLSTVLKPGQTVSVITNPESHPNPDWLNFVVTGRARSGIHNFLKSQLPQKAITLGKKLLENAMHELGLTLEIIPDDIRKQFLLSAKMESCEELHAEIGLGNRFAILVAYQIFNILQKNNLLDKTFHHVDKPFLVRGHDGSTVKFASCCMPVPGDHIVGHLPLDNGLIIHNSNCPIASQLAKKEQFLHVAWASDISDHFPAAIQIEMVDQRGSLALITQTIDRESANIEDITVDQKTLKNAIVTIILSVHDLEHLNRILRRILNLPIVVSIGRKAGRLEG